MTSAMLLGLPCLRLSQQRVAATAFEHVMQCSTQYSFGGVLDGSVVYLSGHALSGPVYDQASVRLTGRMISTFHTGPMQP